jgi:translation initiation factor IF-2
MAEILKKEKRLLQIAKELNVGIEHLVEHLHQHKIEVDVNPNAKVPYEAYELLLEKFSSDKKVKEESEKLIRRKKEFEENIISEKSHETIINIQDTQVKENEFQNEETRIEKEPETIESNNQDNDSVIISENFELDTIEETDISIDNNENRDNTITGDEIIGTKLIVKGKIDLNSINTKTKPDKKSAEQKKEERIKKERERHEEEEKIKIAKKQAQMEAKQKEIDELEAERLKEIERIKKGRESNFIKTEVVQLSGPVVIGKIEINEPKKEKKLKKEKEKEKKDKDNPVEEDTKGVDERRKKRRKRIYKKPLTAEIDQEDKVYIKKKPIHKNKAEINDEDVQKQVRETLAKLTVKTTKTAVKHRKKKREEKQIQIQEEIEQQERERSILKVTEFISANELANLMDVGVNEIIATSFELGKMVTINSRLDAEIIAIIAEEYGFQVQFISASDSIQLDEYEDKEEELELRPPIVTVMGHVDHGKTSLLDFIRDANVIAGEAGGITQHIGAYTVLLDNGNRVTFLDTPGHEAFTAMRARGAKITDIAIIIVAADDSIMPQTEEAISHARAAGVPIVFAINKIDKPGADAERIKKELAERNLLVEEWGGKFQSTDISAKKGINVDKLLDEVILAAEMLELKANPNRPAKGTIIEAELDKGRGYLSTIIVQTGTLRTGDVVLAGANSGKIKAMYDERGNRVKEAGPSTPVQILGLDGAPQAGDLFYVMKSEKEARDIADKNKRIQREQTLRTHKHITLDEIGRRLKLGNFQQINVIIKGDVIGSVEAIADSFVKLGNEEIQVNVIHKGVGQISEADVMLAAASDAIIIGFQVRPALSAKKLAEKEEIDIRLYSIIYQAIEELKDAMEGMLSPEIKEDITSSVEIREVFKITKVGKVAGCFVLDGKISRDDKIRLIREGIVKYEGELGSLRRFKDEVKEVSSGMECGLNINNFNDIKVGDIIESYKTTEIAKKL